MLLTWQTVSVPSKGRVSIRWPLLAFSCHSLGHPKWQTIACYPQTVLILLLPPQKQDKVFFLRHPLWPAYHIHCLFLCHKRKVLLPPQHMVLSSLDNLCGLLTNSTICFVLNKFSRNKRKYSSFDCYDACTSTPACTGPLASEQTLFTDVLRSSMSVVQPVLATTSCNPSSVTCVLRPKSDNTFVSPSLSYIRVL